LIFYGELGSGSYLHTNIALFSIAIFKIIQYIKGKGEKYYKKMILKSSELQVYTKLRTKAGSSLLIKINKLLNY